MLASYVDFSLICSVLLIMHIQSGSYPKYITNMRGKQIFILLGRGRYLNVDCFPSRCLSEFLLIRESLCALMSWCALA